MELMRKIYRMSKQVDDISVSDESVQYLPFESH